MAAMSIRTASPHDTHSSHKSRRLPFVLARHSSLDCYFDIKLTQVESTTFHGKPAQQLEFKLDLARPFDQAKRIRSATVSISVTSKRRKSRYLPKIVGINPEASLVKIADNEITNGQTLGVTAGTPPTVPASAGLSGTFSFGQKTSFAGNRLIHGFLISQNEAQWKMYEEPRSQSGLPPSLSILMIIENRRSFYVSANLCVSRWSGWGPLGVVKSICASEESLQRFPVRHTREGHRSEKELKAQDNITTFLDESNQKMRIKETVVRELFPMLREPVPHVRYYPVLRLVPKLRVHDIKQMNIPFFPNTLLIGRQIDLIMTRPSKTNGFFLAEMLSERHAKIWADNTGKVWIKDIGSSYGTFVRGRRLSPEKQSSTSHELRQHDTVEFGASDFRKDDRDVVSAKIEFVGFPDGSNKMLDLNLVLPATEQDEVDLNDALAKEAKLEQEIETKFDRWQSGTTDEDQLSMLEDLKRIAVLQQHKRFQDLCVESIHRNTWVTVLAADEYDERDGYNGRRTTQYRESRPSRTGQYSRRYNEDYRDNRSPTRTKSRQKSSGADDVLFNGIAPTGEDALATHQTVGRGWSEARLAA